jgi:hypothetical protein
MGGRCSLRRLCIELSSSSNPTGTLESAVAEDASELKCFAVIQLVLLPHACDVLAQVLSD